MEWDIGRIAFKRARLTPNKTAIIFENHPVTYKELNDNVNRVTHWMQDMGIKKGDRISVMLLNCPEFFDIYFAAAKLGVIFVPLNFRLVGPEIEYQLNDSGARLFIFHDVFTNIVHSVRPRIKVENDKLFFMQSMMPDVTGCPEWAADYSEIVKSHSVSEPQPDEPIDLDDPLAIIYTSGVTGAPKGALVSHLQTYFKNIQIMMYMDMNSEDRVLAQLPLFHSGGIFVIATPTLWRGATLLLRQGFNPEQFAEDIEKYKATVIMALTTMWRFILDTGKLDEIDVSSVRFVAGGGERTPLILLDELAKRGLYLQQGFGQTENSAMMMLPKEDVERKKGSIGLPGFCNKVWIADDEWNELPPGKVGRIVCRGPTRMTGYWNKPELTAEAIVNGILDT
ncbi:MAG: AMP-binding protein, partial [Thermodesulfobacteriota bacterium]|nr:AMP-binding protein [Thermodesulfobacteriota bacterium]